MTDLTDLTVAAIRDGVRGGDFVVGDGDARQLGDVANGCGVD